jgi:hypothetical protein
LAGFSLIGVLLLMKRIFPVANDWHFETKESFFNRQHRRTTKTHIW